MDVSPKPLPEIATDALTNALNPKAVFPNATMGGVAQSLWFQVQQATSKQQVTTCLKDKAVSKTDKWFKNVDFNLNIL